MKKGKFDDLNIVSTRGYDFDNRRIITVFTQNIPQHYQQSKKELLEFIKKCMDMTENKEYIILYFNDVSRKFSLSDARLIYDIHNSIDYSYRKNIKAFYFMNSTSSFTFYLSLWWIFSLKFCQKVFIIKQLKDLAQYMNIDSLNIPPYILNPSLKKPDDSEDSKPSVLFGIDLKILLGHDEIKLPNILDTCFKVLETDGVNSQGIFRVAPSAIKYRKVAEELTLEYDCSQQTPIICSAILKKFLKLLPSPLLGRDAFELMKKFETMDDEEKLQSTSKYLKSLDERNLLIFNRILSMCEKIAENHEVNKMDINNLSIIFAPNLIWDVSSQKVSAEDNFSSAALLKYIFVNHVDILK